MSSPDLDLRRQIARTLAIGDLPGGEASGEGTPRPGALGEHPTTDEFVAYQCGELPAKDAESLREHLTKCPSCLEDLLDLTDFVEAGETPSGETADLGAAATWRELHRARGPAKTGWLSLVAASLLAFSVGLGWWAAQQRDQIRQLQGEIGQMAQPQAGALIFDLFPSSSIRGEGEAHPSLELPPEVDYVTLVLHLQEAVPGQLLEVEVEDPRGTRLWRGELRVSDLGTARLGLPRSFLRTGKHHLRAFADEGSTRHEAASFPLEIALPSDKD